MTTVNNNLKISLVIPAYNEEKYIGECLASAIKSSQGRFHEIIVVNNNSTDNTQKVAESFPGVKVVFGEKKGLTKARQYGLEAATGDILAYVDADTRMPAGWYDRIEKEFNQNPKLALLSGPYSYFDMVWYLKLFVKFYYYFAIPIYYLVGYMATGGNFAIRKAVLEKMNGFDTNISFYGEDTNLARRAHEYGKVKFSLSFLMYTSGRRFSGQGLLKTTVLYVLNFFSEVFRHKPASGDYIDIR